MIIKVVIRWYHLIVDSMISLPGEINISIFSSIFAVGIVAGIVTTTVIEKDRDPIQVINPAIAALIGGLLVGRLGTVFLNFSYYQSNREEILALSQGGFLLIGASIGAVTAIWIYAYIIDQPFGKLLDTQLPLFSGAAISAWLGCWVVGCAYGNLSNSGWALPAIDEWGITQTRLPIQLLAITATIAIAYAALIVKKRAVAEGMAAAVFFLGICSAYFMLTYLRADPVAISYGLRWDAWALLGLSLLSGVYLYQVRSVTT